MVHWKVGLFNPLRDRIQFWIHLFTFDLHKYESKSYFLVSLEIYVKTFHFHFYCLAVILSYFWSFFDDFSSIYLVVKIESRQFGEMNMYFFISV